MDIMQQSIRKKRKVIRGTRDKGYQQGQRGAKNQLLVDEGHDTTRINYVDTRTMREICNDQQYEE